MNRYELIYILDAAMEESARKELVKKFSQLIVSNGGEIEKVDEWGKRRLAYTIDYKNEGYYVLIHYKADSMVPREIERNLEISESVIRYLNVKILNKRSSVKPRPVRPAFHAPVAVVAEEATAQAPVASEAVAAEEAATVEVVAQAIEEATPEVAE